MSQDNTNKRKHLDTTAAGVLRTPPVQSYEERRFVEQSVSNSRQWKPPTEATALDSGVVEGTDQSFNYSSDGEVVEVYEEESSTSTELLKCFADVTLKGIDKGSKSLKRLSTDGSSVATCYSVKVLCNTFVNHQIGSVGFTVAEYYRGDLSVKHRKYNLVQVVHGYKFIYPRQLLTRFKYCRKTQKAPKGVFRKSYEYKGIWRNYPLKRFVPYHLVECIFPEFCQDKEKLKEIYNWHAIPFPYESIALPTVGTSTYEEDKLLFRLARLSPSTVKVVPIYTSPEYPIIEHFLQSPELFRKYRNSLVDNYTERTLLQWYFTRLLPKRWQRSKIAVPKYEE
jgi:hypothetical protein